MDIFLLFSQTAGILGNFIVNILSLLYFIQVFVTDTADDDAVHLLYAISLISPIGFALAIDRILVLDIGGHAVTLWSGSGMPLGGSLLMMSICSCTPAWPSGWTPSGRRHAASAGRCTSAWTGVSGRPALVSRRRPATLAQTIPPQLTHASERRQWF